MVVPWTQGEALEEEELGSTHHQPIGTLVREEAVDIMVEHPVDQPRVQKRRDRRLVSTPYVLSQKLVPVIDTVFRRRGHVPVGQRAVLEVLGLLEVVLLIFLWTGLGERRAVPDGLAGYEFAEDHLS